MKSFLNAEPWNYKKFQSVIMSHKRDLFQISIVVLVAFIVRLLTIPFIPENIGLDNPTYQFSASDILKGDFILNCCMMPLYPLALALFGGGEKAQIFVGMVSGLSSVILAWALARCIFEDKIVGLVAAGMMAIYPMAIFYSAIGLTESLFVVLVLGAFISLYKNNLVLTSILFTLSILTRPVMDIFAPVVILWHSLAIRKTGISRALRDLLIYGIFYTIIMSPWWYHQIKKYGHFVKLNYGFGVVLYAGNNPMNKSGGGIGGSDYITLDHKGLIKNHRVRNNDYRDRAIEYIRQNPGKFFRMAWVKFGRFWRLIPYTDVVKENKAAIISTLSVLPIILLALVTLITRRKIFWHCTPILGFIAYLTLVHMITIGSVRYRYPLEPLLIVMAAPSLALILKRFFGEQIAIGERK